MKRYFRIHLKGSPAVWFDMPAPDGFTMTHFSQNLQMSGYVQTEHFYIAMAEIRCVTMMQANGEEMQPYSKPTLVQ